MRQLAFALPLLLLAACGSEKSGTTTKVGNAEVTVAGEGDDGGITITSKDGDSVASMTSGSAAKWPATAPAYAAAYPGSTLVTAMEGNSDGKAGGMASFETTDSADKVIAFYQSRAATAGLTKVTTMAGEGMTMFAATDAQGDTGVSVQTTVADGKTTGAVTFTTPGS